MQPSARCFARQVLKGRTGENYSPMQVFMDWTRAVVVLQVLLQPCLSVLFMVEAEQNQYQAEFGGDVVMGCRFQPSMSVSASDLKVTWHWTSSTSSREVYRLDKGLEQWASQDPIYRGRVAPLRDELENSWAKIKISGLRINDSGIYQCLVQTEKEADYKEMYLSVTAPYRNITKRWRKVGGGDEAVLTCQSDGYPESSVRWWDGRGRPVNASTVAAPTPQQLFTVTSEISVPFRDDNNYTCSFGGGYSATFRLEDKLPGSPAVNTTTFIVLSVVVAPLIVLLAVLLHQHWKGQQLEQDVDEEKRIYNKAKWPRLRPPAPVGSSSSAGLAEDTLRAFWKVRSSDLSEKEKLQVHAFVSEVLPQRLQDNRGRPLSLQALVPEPGQTLFLEGPPGSGKTTIAQFLACSQAAGPFHPPLGAIDLNGVRFLVHLDCRKVKGRLLQEITRLLPVAEEVPMEDELRGALAGSGEVLLLLDGYRDGNQVFDESLKRFLRGRPECRVLVTACPGQCHALKDECASTGVLQLRSTG